MKTILILVHSLILLVFSHKQSVGQKTIDTKLKKQLDSVLELDQHYRAIIMNPAKKDSFAKKLHLTTQQADNTAMALSMHADSANIIFVEKIIKEYGYPGKSLVGKPTDEAAWNVIQHSTKIHQYIGLIKEAANDGELSFKLYATMLDRDLLNQGKEQIYGTQIRSQKMKDGKMSIFVWPIQDAEKVNERRKKAGFDDTVEQNAKKFGVTYSVINMDDIK